MAIFANNARYKREAYRGTPFTAKILASEGIEVAMKVRSVFWVPNAWFSLTTVNVPERPPGDEFEVFIVRGPECLLLWVAGKSGDRECDEYSGEVVGPWTPGWLCQGG